MNYDKIDDSKMNNHQKQILAQAKTIKAQRKELQSLKEENARLLECVTFYADKDNECCGDYQPPNRARQCLKDLGEE